MNLKPLELLKSNRFISGIVAVMLPIISKEFFGHEFTFEELLSTMTMFTTLIAGMSFREHVGNLLSSKRFWTAILGGIAPIVYEYVFGTKLTAEQLTFITGLLAPMIAGYSFRGTGTTNTETK